MHPQLLEDKWKSLYEADFNGAAKEAAATPLQLRAAALAGSWKELYRCRLEKDCEVGGHLTVALQRLQKCQSGIG